ncbi:hypothetical protein HF325_003521 [Metschnikowia pulcherrima]|uniref:Uncharacterized protein n=1 Tax=Metschnikowia pulcherrima TaxID=27326 RepID=A0A8H7GUE4_9ASCO|nr:hypothetical protein HF325_003521 [Metschnikowia pulcherrima]
MPGVEAGTMAISEDDVENPSLIEEKQVLDSLPNKASEESAVTPQEDLIGKEEDTETLDVQEVAVSEPASVLEDGQTEIAL